MKEYHNTSNRKYKIDNQPSEELRLAEEEIKSAEEFERDTVVKKNAGKKQLSIVNEEDEFNFDGSRTDSSGSGRNASGGSDFHPDDHNVK